MKIFVNFLIMLFMVITSISCTKQAGLSSFLSLGRVADGDISFSYEGTTGNIVNVGDVLRVKPSKLETINAKIIDCKIKAGTASLPSGFSVNPLTCEIVGATLSSLPNTIYTLEVINSLGKKSEAYVELRVRSRLTFTGSVSGLTAGQSVAISLTVNGTVVESQTISTNGSYELQNLFDSDSFSLATIHNDNTNYTCTPGTASATVYANVVNNITCFGSGERTVTTQVQGLGASATVNLRLVSDGVNYDLTNAGNGTHSLAALTVGKTYTVEILSTSVGYACFIQSNASGTVNVTAPSVIQCAANGPYTFTIKTRGINAGSISVRKDGILYLNGVGNGDHVLIGASAEQYYGTNYNITFENTPAYHTCSISNNTGIVLGNTMVDLTCEAQTFSVSGSVSGLSNGESVKIQAVTKTGKKEVIVDFSNQNFSIDPFEYNTPYELSLLVVPATKVCTFTTSNYKSGNILGNISGVSLSCTLRSSDRCDVGNIKLDTFNGYIRDISCDATHMYVAGTFTEVGRQALGFYSALATSNEIPRVSNDPRSPAPFDGYGDVRLMEPDGEGGVYLSGYRGVEHYDENFVLKKKLSTYSQSYLVIDGDYIFMQASSNVRKFNRFTGASEATFNAAIGIKCQNYRDLVRIRDHIYCGRSQSVKKIHKNTAEEDTGFSVTTSPPYFDKMYTYNDDLYLVKSTSILRYDYNNNLIRTYTFNSNIYDIAFYQNTMFAVGYFTTVDGVSSKYFSEINLDNHAVTNSVSSITSSGPIRLIHVNEVDKKLYLYSDAVVNYNSTHSKKGVVAFDLNTKSFLSFNVEVSNVFSMKSYQNRLYLGGSFKYVNPTSKRGLVALNLSNGEFDFTKSFKIDSNSVNKIYHDKTNDKLIALGDFNSVGGNISGTSYVAKFSTSDGSVDPVFKSNALLPKFEYSFSFVIPNPNNSNQLYIGGFGAGLKRINYLTGEIDNIFSPSFKRIKPSDGTTSEPFYIYDAFINSNELIISGTFTQVYDKDYEVFRDFKYFVRLDHLGKPLSSDKQFQEISYLTYPDSVYGTKILTNGSVFHLQGSFNQYGPLTGFNSYVNVVLNAYNEVELFTPEKFNYYHSYHCVMHDSSTNKHYLYSTYSNGLYRKEFDNNPEVLRNDSVPSSYNELKCLQDQVFNIYGGVIRRVD